MRLQTGGSPTSPPRKPSRPPQRRRSGPRALLHPLVRARGHDASPRVRARVQPRAHRRSCRTPRIAAASPSRTEPPADPSSKSSGACADPEVLLGNCRAVPAPAARHQQECPVLTGRWERFRPPAASRSWRSVRLPERRKLRRNASPLPGQGRHGLCGGGRTPPQTNDTKEGIKSISNILSHKRGDSQTKKMTKVHEEMKSTFERFQVLDLNMFMLPERKSQFSDQNL